MQAGGVLARKVAGQAMHVSSALYHGSVLGASASDVQRPLNCAENCCELRTINDIREHNESFPNET
jgi:hypothetical protein